MSAMQKFSFVIHRGGKALMKFSCEAKSEAEAQAKADKLARRFEAGPSATRQASFRDGLILTR